MFILFISPNPLLLFYEKQLSDLILMKGTFKDIFICEYNEKENLTCNYRPILHFFGML